MEPIFWAKCFSRLILHANFDNNKILFTDKSIIFFHKKKIYKFLKKYSVHVFIKKTVILRTTGYVHTYIFYIYFIRIITSIRGLNILLN